jgi:CheY-like chemotaxis protein
VAAGRKISRIAAVIDSNAQRAQATVAALEAKGMVVNSWGRGTMGLANLYRIPGLDAIIVADNLSDLTCDQVLAEIAASSRFAETPVLVITDNADSAEELYGSRVAGILADGDLSPVGAALSDSMGRDRELADELSRRSSAALAKLAGQGADVSGALEGLMATITNGRPDAVTIPALRALGHAGRAAEAISVAALAADSSASDAVREAAAMACATMFARGVDGSGCLDSLHGVVASKAALNVRGAAAAALGRLKLNAEMRSELLELVRVNVGE